jgi:hypothetical protein
MLSAVSAVALPVRSFASATPSTIDLGTLGGTFSVAVAVNGDTIVGSSAAAGYADTRGFIYDLAAPSPVMQDLGTRGGGHRQPCDRRERQCRSRLVADDWGRRHPPFAYDLAASSPVMQDLAVPAETFEPANVREGLSDD